MSVREGISFDTGLLERTARRHDLTRTMLNICPSDSVHAGSDARGGVSSAL
jgi:hypothetical protein